MNKILAIDPSGTGTTGLFFKEGQEKQFSIPRLIKECKRTDKEMSGIIKKIIMLLKIITYAPIYNTSYKYY